MHWYVNMIFEFHILSGSVSSRLRPYPWYARYWEDDHHSLPRWGARGSGKVCSPHQLHSLGRRQHSPQIKTGIIIYVPEMCSYTGSSRNPLLPSLPLLFKATMSDWWFFFRFYSQSGVDFLRLGSTLRVHPSIQPYSAVHVCSGLTTVESVEEVYHSKPVVATTSLGINHPIFTRSVKPSKMSRLMTNFWLITNFWLWLFPFFRRSFDVCIVDEASQITLPASLGPLRYASRFVLVGDHYQLPPLVQSQQARSAEHGTNYRDYSNRTQTNNFCVIFW